MAGRVRDLWYSERSGEMTKRHPKHPANKGKPQKMRWQAVWLDADRREKTKAYETKAQATRKASENQVDSDRGSWIDPDAGRESLRTYGARWVERQTVQATTRDAYNASLRAYVYPTLGDEQLRHIAPSHVGAWLRSLQKQTVTGGKAEGAEVRRLGVRTIQQAHRILGMVLQSAVDDGLLPRNAARAGKEAKPPRATASKPEPWDLATVDKVQDKIDERYAPLIAVMAGAGLRQGEALGLAVDDVDFLRKEIHVRRQVRSVRSRQVFALPKYGQTRDVPVTDELIQYLSQYLTQYKPRAVTLPYEEPGEITETRRLLVTSRERKPIHAAYFNQKHWKPALRAAGVDATRANGCHVLRHTFASTLLAQGVGVPAVAKWLGHADAGFTLRVYGHLIPGAVEQSRKALTAAWEAARQSPGDSANRTTTERAFSE